MQMDLIRPRKFYGGDQPAGNGEARVCREETNVCSDMAPRVCLRADREERLVRNLGGPSN